MKFTLILLAGLVAAALATPLINRKIEFQPGKTYVYNYRTQLTTGIPELSQQYAGLLVKSKLILRPVDDQKIWMKLADIRIGSQNGQMADVHQMDLPVEVKELLERHLSIPLEYHYVDGKVRSFEAVSAEPEWSLNMKKSILALLSVDLAPKRVLRSHVQAMNERPLEADSLVYYGVYENTVAGHCETFYEIKQTVDPRAINAVPEVALNVTKVINYGRCVEQPIVVNGNLESQGCDAYCAHYYAKHPSAKATVPKAVTLKGYYPIEAASVSGEQQARPGFVKTACECHTLDLEMPVDQYTVIKYNISQEEKIFQSIHADGQIIVNHEAQQIALNTFTTIKLMEIRPESDDGSVEYSAAKRQQSGGDYVRHENLVFRMPVEAQAEIDSQANLDIPYYGLFKYPSQEKVVTIVKRDIYAVVDDLLKGNDLKSKHTVQRILTIVDKMAILKESGLVKVFEHFVLADKQGNQKDILARKVFLDCLSLTGSNQSAQLIRRAIVESQISQPEAHEILESLAANMYLPSKKTIDMFMKLVKEERYAEKRDFQATLAVTVGRLIKKGCASAAMVFGAAPTEAATNKYYPRAGIHPRFSGHYNAVEQQEKFDDYYCTEAHVEEYIAQFERLLTETTEMTSKMAYIESLAQIGHPKVLTILEPYVSGRISSHRCPGFQVARHSTPKEECDYLRTAIIYSLHQFVSNYPSQCRALVMPIYRDPNESHEVRIAALTLIMYSGPTKAELQSIAAGLRHENNAQIRAMTYAYLKETAELVHPKHAELAAVAREILRNLPKQPLAGYSKVKLHEFVNPRRADGLFVNHQYTRSNNTVLPTSFYLAMGHFHPTGHKNQIVFAYQQRGFETFVGKLYASMVTGFADEWRSLVPALFAPRTQTPETEALLDQIREKLSLKIRKESADLRLKLAFNLFDTNGYHVYDEILLRQKLEYFAAQALETATKLTRGQSVHFVKIFMPASYNKMIVNHLGMPILVRQRQPLIVSLKIESIAAPEYKTQATFAPIALRVHPIVSTLKSIEITAVPMPGTQATKRIGTRVIKQAHFSWPMQVHFRFSLEKQRLLVSLVSEATKDLLVQEIRPVTFVKDSALFWDTIGAYHTGEKLIHVLPAAHQTTKVFDATSVFGYGLKMAIVQDAPLIAEYEAVKSAFDKLAWKPLVQRYIATWLNNGYGYQIIRWSIESEHAQPTYDFALQYQQLTNYPRHGDDYQTYAKRPELDSEESAMNAEESIRRVQWVAYDSEFETVPEYTQATKVATAQAKLERLIGKLNTAPELIREKVNQMIRHTKATWSVVRPHDVKPAVNVHNLIFVALNRGQYWNQFGISAIYAHTLDKQVNWFKSDGFVRAAEQYQALKGKEFGYQHFCTESVLSYPKMLDLFRFPETFQAVSPSTLLKTVIGWGKRTCTEGKVHLEGHFERTAEDKVFRGEDFRAFPEADYVPEELEGLRMAANVLEQQPWFVKQCVEDRKYGRKATVACEMAVEERTKLNKFTFNIVYENLPAEVRNLTAKFEAILRAKYWQYMDLSTEQIENPANKIQIVAHYSDKMMGLPLVDLKIVKPTEEIFFKRILSPFKTVSYLIPKTHKHTQDRCVINERSVRTFDNVTYNMPDTECKYLIAMDCSEQQRFAVYSEATNAVQGRGKVYTAIVRGKVIKLLPIVQSEKRAKIIVDEQEHQITLERPYVLKDLRVYLRHVQRPEVAEGIMMVLEIPFELKLTTDGQNIEVVTGDRFIGRTCGLCGNKDLEAEQEFEGANGCEYKQVADFVHSYAIRSERCSVPEIRGPLRCIKPRVSGHFIGATDAVERDYPTSGHLVAGCEYRKNYVVRKEGQICFSKLPLKACRQSCGIPAAQATKKVDFVCYPQDDVFTQQLVQDSAERVLTELKSAHARHQQQITIPTICARA